MTRRLDRTEYQKVKALIRAGKVGALFIADISRASRDEREWSNLKELLAAHDVVLVIRDAVV